MSISSSAACNLLMLVLFMKPAWGQSVIPLDSLPPPPTELRRLIELGKVSFAAGESDEVAVPEIEPPSDQADQLVASSELSRNFAAETRFRIVFDYDAKTTWRVLAATRQLHIRLRVHRLGWKPSHTLWFRNRPESADFWSNPLVLHEFDHLRLSTDGRIKGALTELLKSSVVIRHQLSLGEVANQELVDSLVDQYMQDRFAESIDLIKIRYQELDRETAHGKQPLGDDSPLRSILHSQPAPTETR